MSAAGPGRLYQVAARQRAALLRGERQAASELVRAYGGVWQRIQAQIATLLAQRAAAERAGAPVGDSWLYQFNRLDTLQRQVEAELRTFAEFADPLITRQQGAAVDAALAHSEELVRVATQQARASVGWAQLPTSAIEDLIGFTANGSPLRELLDALGPAASSSVRDALIQGLALGRGPAAVAREIRQALGGNVARALKISRTETLRAYREATRRSYEANSDVVDGWIWNCACTERSCAMCWAMHGSVHPNSESLNDHPNGRCSMLPYVKDFPGMAPQTLPESGPAQFTKLTPAQQDGILGQAAGRAYRGGAFKLEDVVGRTFDPDWGPGRRVKSLRELVGAEEAEKWRHSVTLAAEHRALGADLNQLVKLQQDRLAELQSVSDSNVDTLLHSMHSARRLPKLDYHFEQHREEFSVSSAEDLNARFVAHIRRDDLRVATALRAKDGAEMWFLVDVDSGIVAQYNASRGHYFSFFRVTNREKFEQNYAMSWVEAIRRGDRWAFQAWLS